MSDELDADGATVLAARFNAQAAQQAKAVAAERQLHLPEEQRRNDRSAPESIARRLAQRDDLERHGSKARRVDER